MCRSASSPFVMFGCWNFRFSKSQTSNIETCNGDFVWVGLMEHPRLKGVLSSGERNWIEEDEGQVYESERDSLKWKKRLRNLTASWFLGFSVSCFVVSWFLRVIVSWFLGFNVSEIQRFKKHLMRFLKDIDTILPNLQFMLSGRYWSHIQDFQKIIRVFMICRRPSFHFPQINDFRTV